MSSADKQKASRGCWTCKDRRVRCDLGLPTCTNCARVQQTCQGYGVRLSWPKDGDTRRSMIGKVSVPQSNRLKDTDIQLVHTSYFDLEMYYYLAKLRSSRDGNEGITQPTNLILPSPLSWKPVDLNAEELETLRYFESTAFSSLATISADAASLRDILVRMALMNHTITSRAVLHAILAFASLHRDGLHLQAVQHKTAAVGALAASAKSGINAATEAAQHVATNMLLCSFEIHIGTDSHGHWPFYLMGAKEIIITTSLDTQIDRGDIAELVMWVYYHDVLARFSLLHWRRYSVSTALSKELGAVQGWQRDLCKSATKLKLNLSPFTTILRYLGDVFDALCASAHSSRSIEGLQQEIHAFELGVENASKPTISPSSSTDKMIDRLAVLTELFRAAVLVYIARVCETKFGELRDLTPLLDRAFIQIEQLHTCERLFPIFILGCEAKTDERRIAILDLVRRTEENTTVRSLECLRRALDSVWIQDDLHADQDMTLDYMNKLNVIVSSSPTLPTFV
ncbi:hypothetical protein HD806DRAFT_484001 [Xylariaceae sp. AK1471]|nr:hypothetical protein HD806DRAFT_484001 [Xylariaceae sp. AK1471]